MTVCFSKETPAPTEVGAGDFLLLAGSVKGGVIGVEVLGVEVVLGDAEGIADFSNSNSRGKGISRGSDSVGISNEENTFFPPFLKKVLGNRPKHLESVMYQ